MDRPGRRPPEVALNARTTRPELSDGARCAGSTTQGMRCASYRALGSAFCWNHDPEKEAERRAATVANQTSRESNRVRVRTSQQ
jgi:hypothetical protein